MSKELEEYKYSNLELLREIWFNVPEGSQKIHQKHFDLILSKLNELQAIKEAKPSEALKEIKTLRGFNQVELNNDENVNKSLDIIEQALQNLEVIDNTEHSEALGLIKRTCEIYADSLKQRDLIGWNIIENQINEALEIIKQALLKSQEQEKVLEIIMEKGLDYHSLSAIKQAKDFEEFKELTENLITKFLDYTQEEFDLLKRYFK